MKLRKAAILAAGEGQRLLPLTSTRPKHLIALAGKPLLQYTIEYLKESGIEEVLLVVGYLKESFIEYFKDGSDFGVKIEYIEQEQFLGTANAAQLAEKFAEGEPFMLIYGDLLMDKEVFQESISTYNTGESHGLICLFKVPDPQKYGIIQLNKELNVVTIVEKPDSDEYGNLANAGVYIFDQKIFDGIQRTQKSKRGEYELTDSIQILVDEGYKIRGLDISGKYWSDVGHPWQLLDANKYLLDNMEEKIVGTIEENVIIIGKVIIEEGALIKSGTRIEGPAFIGKDAIIGPNAFIRPYSAVGIGSRIGNSSEIKNTIVLNHSFLSHFSYAGDSIIGENVNFGAGTVISNVRLDKKEIFMTIKGKRVTTGRKKMGAVIGDNSQLGINSLVMVGIKIGANCNVGAGTIVNRDLPTNSIFYAKQDTELKIKNK